MMFIIENSAIFIKLLSKDVATKQIQNLKLNFSIKTSQNIASQNQYHIVYCFNKLKNYEINESLLRCLKYYKVSNLDGFIK